MSRRAADAAPRDAFTLEMLEATEFKLIAPFTLMRVSTGDDTQFEVKAAESFEPLKNVDSYVPGGDGFLGDIE